MLTSMACSAPPGNVRFLDNRRIFPVVLSSPRYEAIMARSRMDKKHAALAAKEEDDRYMRYLKKGSDWVCSRFTNVGAQTLDEEKQAKLDQELREAEIREKQVKLEDDMNRKKRVTRANQILENLKAGQRALHHAVVDSDVFYQRKYNEAVNREIAEEGRRQREVEDENCPETLIPFGTITEEQIKAEEQAKALIVRAEFLKDLKERREKRLAAQEQEVIDTLIERAQYKCLYEKEQKEEKERKARNRDFCRRAYHDALKEKARIKKVEDIFDRIDDRVICVDVTRRRNLDSRNSKTFKKILAETIQDREDRAIKICRLQQASTRRTAERQKEVEDKYATEIEMDEARRHCELQELARQRRAYELAERQQLEERRKRDAQIRTFEIAERLKNQKTNNLFFAAQKRRKEEATANLRKILQGQHDEFLERRQAEQMRLTACDEDICLEDDVKFFKEAVDAMKKARRTGRPVYPIAKAVEVYRRKNQIDVSPEVRMVGRRKLRDYCWPGYYSKAELAYKKYDHREKCRQLQEKDRHGIFANCIRITKMAAEEQPYKKCEMECPIKCFQHRGMPAIESVDSFDCGSNVCYEDDPLPCGRPCATEIMKPCEQEQQPVEPKEAAKSIAVSLDCNGGSDTSDKLYQKSALLSAQLGSFSSNQPMYRFSGGKSSRIASKKTPTWR